jgi:hypothetical protein
MRILAAIGETPLGILVTVTGPVAMEPSRVV